MNARPEFEQVVELAGRALEGRVLAGGIPMAETAILAADPLLVRLYWRRIREMVFRELSREMPDRILIAALERVEKDLAKPCGETVIWWDGEYEGECELPAEHFGPHFDGSSWFDSEHEEVEPPYEVQP